MKKAGKRITALLIAAIIVFGTAAVGIADFDFLNFAYAAASDNLKNNESAVLARIEVSIKPDKLVYTVGDTLDTSGMMLLLINSDGSNKTATVGYTCNPT
ncbi:MAG: hypothetical protein IJB16_04335, partial [Clostridia bacterium]|nr:hypothetical protein [Clostridia bacterium]